MTTAEATAIAKSANLEAMLLGRNLENVKSVYVGKRGKCTCGCAGAHHETPRMINKVWKMLAAIRPVQDGDDASYLYAESDEKIFVAYF